MKKTIKIMLTLAFVIAALCVTAAADGTNGFYDIGEVTDVAITAYAGAEKVEVDATEADVDADDTAETYYEGSDRLGVTYSAATAGEDYGVILVEGSSLPTASSAIYYINQDEAADTSITFDVYPSDIAATKTEMTLYISSSVADAELVSVPMAYVVGYEEEEEVVINYGDVDNSGGTPNIRDRVYLGRYLAGGYELDVFNVDAANCCLDFKTDGSPNVNIKDRVYLARFLAGGYFDPNVLPQQ